MLSSAKIGTSSWRYYVDQAPCRASEYYLGHDQDLGRWEGRGLQRLGLTRGGAVTEQQLEALFGRAINPATGERLGRAWRSDGVTGFDLTFSAPKSVSALHAMQRTLALQHKEQQLELFHNPLADSGRPGAETAALVAAAHDTAIRTALTYLDAHAGLSRRGTDGTEQVTTSGFAVAMFTHHTSREGDPQLHTHALLLNKVQCDDGTWRTLDGHELYAHRKSAGMIYQAVLRNELTSKLGVQFGEVSKDGQAEILGIPEILLEKWSKRTHAINSEAAEAIAGYERLLGRTLTDAERVAVTKVAVLKTRPAKTHEEQASLADRWTKEAATVGVDLRQLLIDAHRAARDAPQPADRADDDLAAAALTAAGRTRAVFGRADVAGQVARLLPASGLHATEMLARIETLTDRALALGEAVHVGASVHGVTPRASDPRFATVEVLAAESRILSHATTGARCGAGQVGWELVRATLTAIKATGAELDRSQTEALLHLTTHGDALDVLTAPAGAGKTATLGATALAWSQAGYRVIGLAPSARAAAELGTALTDQPGAGEASAGSGADTLAKWLHTRALVPELDALDPAAAGRHGWARLDERTVLIVDEASMASTLDLDQLLQAARAARAKVVLVGDPAQIGVINGPGGMLAHLARGGHAVALTGIHRFSSEWEKDASLALRDGDADAVAPYLGHDRLHACPDADQAADAVFAHWQQATRDGHDALMLARTRLDVDALNARARAAAQADARLTGPTVELGGRHWQHGDVLRARRNQRQLTVGDSHVRNGDRFTVLGSSPEGGLVVEDLTGRGRTTLPPTYVARHAEYGWAATIDGSQGATCDLGLVLLRPGLDREHLYVAMTRGRHGNHAYLTPDPARHADPDHHLPPVRQPAGRQELEQACLDVLRVALTVRGAQDSAHTAQERARSQAQRKQAPQGAVEPARPTPRSPQFSRTPLRPAAASPWDRSPRRSPMPARRPEPAVRLPRADRNRDTGLGR